MAFISNGLGRDEIPAAPLAGGSCRSQSQSHWSISVVLNIDGDASVMSPLDAASMAIKQQAVDLHHPVNPLVIGRLQASGQRLALEDGVDTSVAPQP